MSWTGAALILIGLWIILRTVRGGNQGKTLVNHILGK
ncbi:MAG: hypothetical protein QOF85_951 [Solirubrobacterales bacterium]|jgi:hypothetical protein|nr:hypothetical protein [Solirubrobacterales bacterium]